MNVFLATDAFPPGAGGSGQSTAALAKALHAAGHRVRVAVARDSKQGQSAWDGVEVVEIEVPSSRFGNAGEREAAYVREFPLALGEEPWDLVHAQHWLSASAARRSVARLPLVVTVRDYWPVCLWSTMLSGDEACPGCSYPRRVRCVGRNKPWLWPITPLMPPLVGSEIDKRQRLLTEASAVIAVSAHVASVLPRNDIHVIPNMLDVDALERASTTPHHSEEELPERFVLFVGKLEPNKAADQLLPILDEAGCGLPLVVAGSGRLEPVMKEEANRRSRDARFLGWVPASRLPSLMRRARVVLFPSRWQEPLSRVLLEGLGSGALFVAQPTGGTQDIIVDGESGLLGRDVHELASALRRALSDDSLSGQLRAGAEARARAHFAIEAVLPRVEALYRSVT